MTPPPLELSRRYENVCLLNTDIRAHLPLLAKLSAQCDSVVELGVREGNSTTALLYGQPSRLHCVDIAYCPVIDELSQMAGATALSFWQGDSREAEVLDTDMLFIDTEHNYECLSQELARHGGSVRKYIALHDTQTLGPQWNYRNNCFGPSAMLTALYEFLQRGTFQLYHHSAEDYGFTVLVRCS